MKTWFGAVLLAVAVVGAVVYGANSSSTKVIAGAVGMMAFIASALLSGNQRLFCLWSLMVTITFDLSKHFGPLIGKMGGESSFKIEMSDPFILALFVFQLRDMGMGLRSGVRIPKVTFLWMTIVMLGVLAFILGPFSLTAAHESFRMVKVIVLFLVLCNELDRSGKFLHCAGGLALGILIQSIVALIQYKLRRHLGLDLLGETRAGTMDQLAAESLSNSKAFRVGALMNHPNIFGVFLAAVLPFAVGAFLLKLGRGYRILFLSAATLGMAGLIVTLSRSGWVSFAASFTVLLTMMSFHKGLRRRSLMAAAAATVALLGICVVFARPIIDRIYDSKDSAMLSRAEYIDTAKRVIARNPILGWGMNSYVFVAPPFTKYGTRGALDRYKGWVPPVHNIYYLYWAELGIVGLTLHLLVWTSIIFTAFQNLRVRNELLFTINAAALSGMVALVIDGFFSFTLRINSILRVYWVLAAIILAVYYWERRQIRAEAEPQIPLQVGVGS